MVKLLCVVLVLIMVLMVFFDCCFRIRRAFVICIWSISSVARVIMMLFNCWWMIGRWSFVWFLFLEVLKIINCIFLCWVSKCFMLFMKFLWRRLVRILVLSLWICAIVLLRWMIRLVRVMNCGENFLNV